MLPFARGHCFGTTCLCDNPDPARGCKCSVAKGARLSAYSSASIAADDVAFRIEHLPPGQPTLLFSAQSTLNGGRGVFPCFVAPAERQEIARLRQTRLIGRRMGREQDHRRAARGAQGSPSERGRPFGRRPAGFARLRSPRSGSARRGSLRTGR